MRKRVRVEIAGAVQGVGFRPFVFRLAGELGLDGWVINDGRGVVLEAEGREADLRRLLDRLTAERPAPSIVEGTQVSWLEAAGQRGFRIERSRDGGRKTVQVLADIATCPACLAEVLDAADRRHGYPFTNCTNCGPRFSIIDSLPYDRPGTTMRRFTMCAACRAEYERPADRRFHAQPNACQDCGPRLSLWGAEGATQATAGKALAGAAAALERGKIVAVKGLGGFHLMVNARDGEALARLREKKPRRDKPFALMVRDLAGAAAIVELDEPARNALRSSEAPILLLRRRPDAKVHEDVAPGNPNLGIMLPYTPLHHLLLGSVGFPLVATSGNLSDEPICTDEHDAASRLRGIAELFLVHDRPIARHVDDSVMWILGGEPRLLRRARGHAPRPVMLDAETPGLLAVGAHLKNAVALSVGRHAFVSQHIGDMETPQALEAFERVIADFVRLYEARPEAIVHDLHPDYVTTRWAREVASGERSLGTAATGEASRPPATIAVQHHHAHLAACLAENAHEGPVLGVTWDGTGYGTDGTVWGGEFLLGDRRDFRRVAHLRRFRLPGGDAAVREPRRSALALLWQSRGDTVLDRDDLDSIRAFTPAERRLLGTMLGRGVNSPWTTSAGRLFDGVAALAGLMQSCSFEGQAAMALEFAAAIDERGAYPIAIETVSGATGAAASPAAEVSNSGDTSVADTILDWRPLVEAVLEDRRRGVAAGVISARFHNALVNAIVQVARRVGQPTIALTGGCFQNRLLTERADSALREAGFRVLLHRQVPPNDGGISLGQIAVAAARWSDK